MEYKNPTRMWNEDDFVFFGQGTPPRSCAVGDLRLTKLQREKAARKAKRDARKSSSSSKNEGTKGPKALQITSPSFIKEVERIGLNWYPGIGAM